MNETVLVTGGSGYVAGWCIAALLQRGYRVRATLRSLERAEALRAAIATVAVQAASADRLAFVVADLTADAGWDAAMADCSYVLHTASPLGFDHPREEQALVGPARDGSLRVLAAAARAGVKRVVMTSACAAASPTSYAQEGMTDESLWTDPEAPGLDAYRKSKTLAEQAAWRFVAEHGAGPELATILPGAVFGPVLSADRPGSVQVIGRLLQGRVRAAPRLGFEVVDVRDLAEAHLRAMTSPQAAGQRFIAAGEFMWMGEIARVLRLRLGAQASRVPTRDLPDWAVRALARFNPDLRRLLPALGRRHRHTSDKARRLLGWSARPAADTVADCARSLIEQGVVRN